MHGESKRRAASITNPPPRKPKKPARGGATRAKQAKGDRDLLGLSPLPVQTNANNLGPGICFGQNFNPLEPAGAQTPKFTLVVRWYCRKLIDRQRRLGRPPPTNIPLESGDNNYVHCAIGRGRAPSYRGAITVPLHTTKAAFRWATAKIVERGTSMSRRQKQSRN